MENLPVAISIDHNRSIEKFVYATWLRQFKESYYARSIKPKIYFAYQALSIEDILQRPTTRIIKAHLQSDEDQFFGYSIIEHRQDIETFIHHFTFVKMEFRQMGIGRKLMEYATSLIPSETDIRYYSHNNANAKNGWVNLWLEEKWKCFYNPYLG